MSVKRLIQIMYETNTIFRKTREVKFESQISPLVSRLGFQIRQFKAHIQLKNFTIVDIQYLSNRNAKYFLEKNILMGFLSSIMTGFDFKKGSANKFPFVSCLKNALFDLTFGKFDG